MDEALRREVEELLAASEPADDVLSDGRIASGERRVPWSAPEDEPDTVALPESIDGYRVVRRIGEGGMGVVYEAEQDAPRRRVALKLVRAELAFGERLRRFRLEAEALGRLKHPGIAQVYALGTCDVGRGEQPYFAMELVDGEPLLVHAASAHLDRRARLALVAELCDAVQHAHERGVVHRDLKPDNVLVDAAGRAKVLDFGVARVRADDVALTTVHTSQGQLVGTLTHMAPEQLAGDPDAVGPAADVYALGVIAFELLTGRLPHEVAGLPITQAMRRITEGEAPLLGALDRGLRGDVETIVGVALAQEPERRYVSAAALAADLRRYLAHEPIAARRPSLAYRASRFTRRHRAAVLGASATFVSLVAGLVFALDFARRESAALERARRESVSTRVALYGTTLRSLEDDPWKARRDLHVITPESRGWAWRWMNRQTPLVLPSEYTLWVDERTLVALVTAKEGVPEVARVDLSRPDDFTTLAAGFTPRALSARGSLLVSQFASADYASLAGRTQILALDPRSGAIVREYPGVEWPWIPVAESLDGTLLIRTLEMDARIWRPEGMDPPHATRASLFHQDLTSDGKLLAVDQSAKGVRVLRAGTKEVLWRRDEGPIQELAFEPGGERLAVLLPGTVQVHAGSSGELLARFAAPPGSEVRAAYYHDLSWSSDGKVLGVATHSGHARLYDPDSGEELYDFGERRSPIDATIELGPRGRMASLPALDGDSEWIVDTQDAEDPRFRRFEGHASKVQRMSVSPAGDLLATCAPGEDRILVWDAWTAELLVELEADLGTPGGQGLLSFDARSRHLVFSDVGGLVSVDLCTGARRRAPASVDEQSVSDLSPELLAAFRGLTGRRRPDLNGQVAVHPEGRRFLSQARGDPERNGQPMSRDWSAPALTRLRISAVDLSPDGERLAVGRDSGTGMRVGVVDARIGEVVHSAGSGEQVLAVAWSPDGALLAVGVAPSGEVSLYEARFFNRLLTLPAHSSHVLDLAWSPDGEMLYSAAADGEVRLWDSVHPIARRFRAVDRAALAAEARAELDTLVARSGDHAASVEVLLERSGGRGEPDIAARRACLESWTHRGQ